MDERQNRADGGPGRDLTLEGPEKASWVHLLGGVTVGTSMDNTTRARRRTLRASERAGGPMSMPEIWTALRKTEISQVILNPSASSTMEVACKSLGSCSPEIRVDGPSAAASDHDHRSKRQLLTRPKCI